jgi:hypothetical protein
VGNDAVLFRDTQMPIGAVPHLLRGIAKTGVDHGLRHQVIFVQRFLFVKFRFQILLRQGFVVETVAAAAAAGAAGRTVLVVVAARTVVGEVDHVKRFVGHVVPFLFTVVVHDTVPAMDHVVLRHGAFVPLVVGPHDRHPAPQQGTVGPDGFVLNVVLQCFDVGKTHATFHTDQRATTAAVAVLDVVRFVRRHGTTDVHDGGIVVRDVGGQHRGGGVGPGRNVPRFGCTTDGRVFQLVGLGSGLERRRGGGMVWLLLPMPNFDVSFGRGRSGAGGGGGGGGSGGLGSVVVAHFFLNGVGKTSWFSQITRFGFGGNMFCLFYPLLVLVLVLVLVLSLLRFWMLPRLGADFFNGVC